MSVIRDRKNHALWRLLLVLRDEAFLRIVIKRTGIPDPILEKSTIEDYIIEMGDDTLNEIEAATNDIILGGETVGYSHLLIRKKILERQNPGAQKLTFSAREMLSVALQSIFNTLHEVCTPVRERVYKTLAGSRNIEDAKYYTQLLSEQRRIENEIKEAYDSGELTEKHEHMIRLVGQVGLERASQILAKSSPNLIVECLKRKGFKQLINHSTPGTILGEDAYGDDDSSDEIHSPLTGDEMRTILKPHLEDHRGQYSYEETPRKYSDLETASYEKATIIESGELVELREKSDDTEIDFNSLTLADPFEPDEVSIDSDEEFLFPDWLSE